MDSTNPCSYSAVISIFQPTVHVASASHSQKILLLVPMSSLTDFKLSDRDVRIKNHATLCSIGFIILLPFGALTGRYLRTFTNRYVAVIHTIGFRANKPVYIRNHLRVYLFCAPIFGT